MSLSTIISLSYRRQIPPFTSTEHFRLDPSSGSYRLKHREQLLRMCLFRIILRCISIASNLPHPHVRTKISSRQNRVCVCVSKRTFNKNVHVLANYLYSLACTLLKTYSEQTTNNTALHDRTPADGPTPTCLCEVGRVTAGLHGDVTDHTFNLLLIGYFY